MNIDTFLEQLAFYPVGTILVSVALVNLGWLTYIVLVKENYKKRVYRYYFFYAISALFWVIFNAYFQSSLLFKYDESMARTIAILANISSSMAIVSFYCLASQIRFNRKSFGLKRRLLILAMIMFGIGFNLIPGATIQAVKIMPEGGFQLIFGPWNGLFFGLGIFVIFLAVRNFFLAVKGSRDNISNRRIYYILFGMSLMYGSVIFFHIMVPNFFNNYQYVWIPPLLSLADIAIVGYAIITQRFIDIRVFISRFFKVSIAFLLSGTLVFPMVLKLARISTNIRLIYWEIFGIGLILFLFNRILALLNSRVFYRYFGGADAEHISYITNELRRSGKVYTSIESYEKDLQRAFQKKLRRIEPKIIIADEVFLQHYPLILDYFKTHRGMLITEELKFAESNRDEMTPLLREIESLGGICIPLFHPRRGLVGLFTLGQKNYNHLYTREEIEALESLGSYLNATVTNILYNSELEKEVDEKTRELKKKVREINEILKQQSDFISVTAHEFRTPLSIAAFQLEEILSSDGDLNKQREDIKVVEYTIDNLKQLTERLFAIQQYDLNKVELNLETVSIRQFIKKIHKEFKPIMAEKEIKFDLKDMAKGRLSFQIDPIQMRQVLHNLLRNASKFTPQNGHVVLSLSYQKTFVICVEDSGEGIPDDMKDSIFEKFRTKSSGAGIGLGLYLCKKIIELHRGKIWVEDSKLGGAKFMIELKV